MKNFKAHSAGVTFDLGAYSVSPIPMRAVSDMACMLFHSLSVLWFGVMFVKGIESVQRIGRGAAGMVGLVSRDDLLLSEIESAVYALDATTIELCLALFPWARAQNHLTTCAGVKLHTLLDVQRNLPVFARISVANLYEVHILDELVFEPGAFYVLDRGYTDFRRLKTIDSSRAFFVIRAKKGLRFTRTVSHAVDKSRGIHVDQTIHLVIKRSLEGYPDTLRRIKFFDMEKKRTFVFLTNNFLLDAAVIAELYRSRWKIELFFKWIKQHLRIKAFYGTTSNAVNTQIWIALSVFVLVAIIKKELDIHAPLYTILQILSVTLFEKEPINQILTATAFPIDSASPVNQLNLFNV